MQDMYRGSSSFYLKEIFFSCGEDVLAQPLRRVQDELPAVQVGSYPDVNAVSTYSVRVALESKDRDLVEKVREDVIVGTITHHFIFSVFRRMRTWFYLFQSVSFSTSFSKEETASL